MVRMRQSVTKKAKTCKKAKGRVLSDKKEAKKLAVNLEMCNRMLQSISTSSNFIGEGPKSPKIVLSAKCPKCQYVMSDCEILNGALSGLLDIRTTCPDCNYMFETTLCVDQFLTAWLCQEQTIDQYEHWYRDQDFKEDSDPKEIMFILRETRPELFWNAVKYSTLTMQTGQEDDDFITRVARYLTEKHLEFQ